MTMLAAVRPHSWDLAVFVHVIGAMILVGGLITAAGAGIIGWRDEQASLRRLSALTLFAVALPGWIIMRLGAEWAYSKEGWDDLPDKLQPTWLSLGYITADIGGIVLLVALVLGGIGIRRARSGNGARLLRASTALAAILIAVYVVSVWAMGGKPS
ncbi:MAG TPA: hypothetical protein VFA66_06075 [Gaiellaceae bacterium]|nr:hypothetical protein [Gaiellaceae bacterium]